MIIKKSEMMMGFAGRGIRAGALLGVLWIAAGVGCAEGEIAAPPETMTMCTSDAECEGTARCDVVAGVCRAQPGLDMTMDMSGGVVPDMPVVVPDMRVSPVPDLSPPVDMGTPDMMNTPEDLGMDMAPPVDMPVVVPDMEVDPCLDVTCAPRDNMCEGDFLVSYAGGVCNAGTCSYGETRTDCTVMNNRKCENGACVDRQCDPGCEAPGTCNAGTCAFPTCMAEGDACDPSPTEQGNFLCLIDDQTTGAAHCYSTCLQAGSDQGCNVGQRCFAAVTSDPSLLICLDSECGSDADCGTGTCLKFENSFGVCEPGGPGATGAACNPGAGQWCQQGNVCAVASGSTQGTCEKTCEPWTGAGCGASEYCGIYTTRMGTCTSDQDATGAGPFEECSTAGNYCDDATPCFGTSTVNVCLKYCRPNSADCAGIDPSVTCDNYLFPGDRALGLCFASACTTSADCTQASDDCVGGLCRSRCTQGSVVADCGSANWSCVAGYCE